MSTFLFRGDEPSSRQQAQAWAALGRSTQLFITPQDGCLTDLQGGKVGASVDRMQQVARSPCLYCLGLAWTA